MNTHTHTHTDMDKRRLCYLAYTLQQDMELQAKHTTTTAHTSRSPITHTPPPLPNLESLMEQREREIEQCNMLLLLLLACLEYSLPVEVMRATLETAKLTNIGYVHVHVTSDDYQHFTCTCTCSLVPRPYSQFFSVSRACVEKIGEPGYEATVHYHVCTCKRIANFFLRNSNFDQILLKNFMGEFVLWSNLLCP